MAAKISEETMYYLALSEDEVMEILCALEIDNNGELSDHLREVCFGDDEEECDDCGCGECDSNVEVASLKLNVDSSDVTQAIVELQSATKALQEWDAAFRKIMYGEQ